MAQTPPAKAPTGPKVSGTRTIISLIFLVIVLIVCGIELRAGLGQFMTLRSFDKVSENNLFKNVPLAEAQGMVAAFPSKSDVQVGDFEDVHHYYWYSMLRPLMGKKNPELFISADHNTPPNAVSFYTSTEGEIVHSPVDPNAPPASAPMSTMPPGGPRAMDMNAPPGGGPSGGGGKGGKGSRPPLEDAATDPETKDPAAEPAKTESESGATPTEPVAPETNATPEPAADNAKSETPAEPK
ncbi:MAG: hypothetical protein H7Z17_01605 [Fuerstia sp.]|nr:hypothetical protein [Fuerstiella sp.]